MLCFDTQKISERVSWFCCKCYACIHSKFLSSTQPVAHKYASLKTKMKTSSAFVIQSLPDNQSSASEVFLDIFNNASICLLKTIEAMQFLKGTKEKGRNQTGSLHYLLPKIAQQKVWAFGFRQRITPTSTKFFPPSRSHNKYHHMV